MAKTIVRIYEENGGWMGCEVMTESLDRHGELQIVGMLEQAKMMILEDVETNTMTNEEVSKIRKLLD